MNRKIVRLLLQSGEVFAHRGVEIEEADDGSTAVEAVRRRRADGGPPFDFIFMDYIMVSLDMYGH
jgi:CheY-like chemotaxis protein